MDKIIRSGNLEAYVRPRNGQGAASGPLQAVITFPDGRRERKATGFEVGQEAEAEAFITTMLAELSTSLVIKPATGETTFKAWGDRWLTGRRTRDIASIENEQGHLEFHAYPTLGAIPLRALTKADMIAWVRGLSGRISERTRDPISPRTVHHIAATVKRCLSEAVDSDLILVNPCAWKTKRDLPVKADKDSTKRRTGGFKPWEVWELTHNPKIPEDRRTLYALEFLTGMRTGEAAIRRWRDVVLDSTPLARLEVGTAYNSGSRKEKTTKTHVEKICPVHPELLTILQGWHATGWAAYAGRAPTPDDLIVPAERGGVRNAGHSNALFKEDIRTLGFRPPDQERRTHYESRSTFRSLAIAGGAQRADLNLITHPSPREASDLYTRLDEVWPALCRCVQVIKIGPQSDADVAVSRVTSWVTPPTPEMKKARNLEGFGPSEMARGTGVEPVAFSSGG
jgi:integrase